MSAICPTCSATSRRCRSFCAWRESRPQSSGAASRRRSISTASSGRGSTAQRSSGSTCRGATTMLRTSSTCPALPRSTSSRSASGPGSARMTSSEWSERTTCRSCTTSRSGSHPRAQWSGLSRTISATRRRMAFHGGAARCAPRPAQTSCRASSQPASTSRPRAAGRNGGSSAMPSHSRRCTAGPGRGSSSTRRGLACSRTRRTIRSAAAPRTRSPRRCSFATQKPSRSARN